MMIVEMMVTVGSNRTLGANTRFLLTPPVRFQSVLQKSQTSRMNP